MKEMKYFFSVIIPVFNSEDYLFQSVISVLSQKYNRVEIILVNDCSTDKSTEICGFLSEQYPEVRVINNEKNLGVGISRNKGIKFANGKYIIFLDSDDELFPESLEHLEKNILSKSHPDVAIVHYKKDTFPRSNYDLLEANKNHGHDIDQLMTYVLKNEFPFSDQWSFVVNNSFITANGIYFSNTRIGESEYFVAKLVCAMKNFICVMQPFYKKKDRDGGLNHTVGLQAAYATLENTIDLYSDFRVKNYCGQRLDFYQSYIQSCLGIFSGLLITLESNKIKKIAALLDKNKDKIYGLIKQPEKIDFYQELSNVSSFQGLLNIRKKITKSKVKLIKEFNLKKDVYLYCRSKYTSASIKLLNESGYKIKGIVDDNEQFSGTKLDGYETITTKTLFNNIDSNIDENLIIITHQRNKTISKITKNLVGNNIKRNQIISITY